MLHFRLALGLLLLRGVLIEAGVGGVSLAEVALGVLGNDPVLVDGVRVGLGEDGPGPDPTARPTGLDGLRVSGLPVDGELEVLPHLVQKRLLAVQSVIIRSLRLQSNLRSHPPAASVSSRRTRRPR